MMFNFICIALTVLYCQASDSLVDPGCQQQVHMDVSVYVGLYEKMQAESFSNDRMDVLTEFLSSQKLTKGFNSSQAIGLIELFPFSSDQTKCLDAIAPVMLGLKCADVALLLKTASFSSDKLKELQAVVNLVVDLKVNNETIINEFSFSSDKETARKIIAGAKAPRSCVWGDVAAMKRGIFIIDTSGSMSTTFVDPSGKTWTRLAFVTSQLATIIKDGLNPDQEFNIIRFGSSASAWNPGVVPVNDNNIQTAVQYLAGLGFSGGTNMIAAVKLAISDPRATSIYLLSDGQPNGGTSEQSAILSLAQGWSKQNGDAPFNTIFFSAGGSYDQTAANFMEKLASSTGGLARAIGK